MLNAHSRKSTSLTVLKVALSTFTVLYNHHHHPSLDLALIISNCNSTHEATLLTSVLLLKFTTLDTTFKGKTWTICVLLVSGLVHLAECSRFMSVKVHSGGRMYQNVLPFMAECCSPAWVDPFIHHGHLSCVCLLGIVMNAAVNTGIQVSVWGPAFCSYGFIPRTGIAGSWGNSMFNLLRSDMKFYNIFYGTQYFQKGTISMCNQYKNY